MQIASSLSFLVFYFIGIYIFYKYNVIRKIDFIIINILLSSICLVQLYYGVDYLESLLLVNCMAFFYNLAYIENIDNIKNINVIINKIIIWVINLFFLLILSLNLYLNKGDEKIIIIELEFYRFEILYELAKYLQLFLLLFLLFLLFSFYNTRSNTLLKRLKEK